MSRVMSEYSGCRDANASHPCNADTPIDFVSCQAAKLLAPMYRTNPPPSCTTDGLSTGSICNSQTATVSDDDGGYLRTAAGAYYTAPIPLS